MTSATRVLLCYCTFKILNGVAPYRSAAPFALLQFCPHSGGVFAAFSGPFRAGPTLHQVRLRINNHNSTGNDYYMFILLHNSATRVIDFFHVMRENSHIVDLAGKWANWERILGKD